MRCLVHVLFIALVCWVIPALSQYQPNWKSLDSRPLPAWYDEAKVGIFMHWGMFTAIGYSPGSVAWFWYYWKAQHNKMILDYMKKNYPPSWTYADFAPMFKAEFFEPEKWADLFEASGARYVVLTSKHHDGFCNWPSKVSWNWNSMDIGPRRDLVGDLANAIRNRTNIHFGLYHSLFEFFNPLYLRDKANLYTTQDFVRRKTMPELYDLVNRYKPELIWSDGEWEADSSYWNSTNFLAWLYNDSPVKDVVVVNDRWGNDTRMKHGGYWNGPDKWNPKKLIGHKWENAMILDFTSWAYRKVSDLRDYMTLHELLSVLAKTISCGGNILMNIGPTDYGTISPLYEDILRGLGKWLNINGEAIYASKPWAYQNDDINRHVWYTSKNVSGKIIVYAIVLEWPVDDILFLGAPNPSPATQVSLLGYAGKFDWRRAVSGGIIIYVPPISFNQMPSTEALVFKLEYLNQFENAFRIWSA